eukprot:Nk52_evm5s78 gene=Nk52_evmTU5s78
MNSIAHMKAESLHSKRKLPFSSVLVTGCSGFVGSYVVDYLLRCDDNVCVFGMDITDFSWAPIQSDSKRFTFLKGSIVDEAFLDKITKGVESVIHTAACLRASSNETFHNINVEGTRALIRSCKKNKVKALTYVSSMVVCWDGWTPHISENESLPYLHSFYDPYSKSKYDCEVAVLKANLENDGELKTAAVRAPAIYGPGEKNHFKRLLESGEYGLLCGVGFGDKHSLFDWVHGHNLAHALVLCTENVYLGGPCCGKPYFVSDGEGINHWGFFNPLLRELGYVESTVLVPTVVFYYLAWFLEVPLHATLRLFLPTAKPLLTRLESCVVTVSRTYSIKAITVDAGYKPQFSFEQGSEQMAAYLKEYQEDFRKE